MDFVIPVAIARQRHEAGQDYVSTTPPVKKNRVAKPPGTQRAPWIEMPCSLAIQSLQTLAPHQRLVLRTHSSPYMRQLFLDQPPSVVISQPVLMGDVALE